MSEPVKPKPKSESIRQWYHRTTSVARKILAWLTVLAISGALIAFFFMPENMTAKLQAFNSAVTTPTAIFLWTFGLLFMFLIPQRESGFRSQEFIEAMSNSVRNTIEKEIIPAATVWKRVGERIELELPIFIKKVDEGIAEIREASKKLTLAIEKSDGLSVEAKLAIESLKRIETKVEEEIKNGFFENARAALDSVRSLGGIQSKEDARDELSYAIKSIQRNKAAGRAS